MNEVQKQIREYMKEAIMDSGDISLSEAWSSLYELVMDSVSELNYKQVGYLHTMHKELDQSNSNISFDERHPWGVQGKDFDPSYTVTTKPVYTED